MEIYLSSVFKKFVWDLTAKEVINSFLTSLAISTTGPISVIAFKILIPVLDKFYELFIKQVKLETIKLVNDSHQKALDTSMVKLKIVAIESGINSKEFKDAHEIEKKKFYSAVESSGDPLILRIGSNT
jgi:branched-subunit amino acid permease